MFQLKNDLHEKQKHIPSGILKELFLESIALVLYVLLSERWDVIGSDAKHEDRECAGETVTGWGGKMH
jgi:hypothetical protein